MNSKRHGASFTLVEMLVGLAVFSLLILLVFSILGNSVKLWRQQSARDEGFREARAALNAMSRDMSAAIVSTNINWFYISTNGSETTPFQLAFLTTLPASDQDSTNKGDICAVGYSLEWGTNDASGVQTNLSLYRYVRFSDLTTSILIGGVKVQDVFNSSGGTSEKDLIARNVSAVTFDAYTNDSSGQPEEAPAQAFLSNMMINVSLTTLNDRAATLLSAQFSGNSAQAQWSNTNLPAVSQNQEFFTLRVKPLTQ